MSAKLWTVFKRVRVAIFVLATILSMAWAVVYAIILLREWKFYDGGQRAILIILLVINSLSTIMLYLMIIVVFKLWLDGARVAFLLLFQVGGTVTFALFKQSLPCNNIGSEKDCKTVENIAIFGGWSLSGLLLLYAFCLAVMSSQKPPPPTRNPEAILVDFKDSRHSTPSINSGAWLMKTGSEKRRSITSNYSHYSQRSYVAPNVAPVSRASSPGIIRSRSPSLSSQPSVSPQYGVYQPQTPLSMRSPAASSISGPRSPASGYYFKGVESAKNSYGTPRGISTTAPQRHLLPNPFLDPITRYDSPMSVYSHSSSRSDGYSYPQRQFPRALYLNPERLLPTPFRPPDQGNPLPPYADPRQIQRPPTSQTLRLPDQPHGRFAVPDTPMSLRPAIQPSSFTLDRVASPGMASLHSSSADIQAYRFPERKDSVTTIPRSPSPPNRSQYDIPYSPRSAMLPGHPRLIPIALASGRVHEVRRFGSVPDLRYPPEMTRYGTPAVSATTPVESYSPQWSAGGQWKQNVTQAAVSGYR